MKCQCQGIEEVFNEPYVEKELARLRSKGPVKTTRILVDAIKREGVHGSTLLDIGGGLGAVQHELLAAGAAQATDVDASTSYLAAARSEAQRRGLDGRVRYLHGDFVDLAGEVDTADIVTLDRVICCYDDMQSLVDLSVRRARKIYALVFPRDSWWTKIALAVESLSCRIRKSPFRAYVHPTKAVEAIVNRNGFHRTYYRRTWLWQVVLYSR